MQDKRKLMEEKVEILNHAARVYYQEGNEVMSNREYDEIYDELLELEKETGIVLSNSPTVNVGYEIISNLPKEKHPSPMLSLDKTKEVEELRSWLGDKEGLLSWKLDGLTIVLTYRDGKLAKAVTRGDGVTGEVITNNAKVFDNIPLTIPEKAETIVRGEAVITYPDFEAINKSEEDDEAEAKYKNPRNLCSGTVRQLNNEVTAKRHVKFYAFTLAGGGGAAEDLEYRHEQMEWLAEQGFDTVEYYPVNAGNLADTVGMFAEKILDFEIPSDGLVLIFDDIAYGVSLGRTAKFPKDAIAFKWMDEMKDTTLLEVLWNPSRTGLINPIAVFEPIELEGTTVSRASVHNVSIVEELALGTGDTIKVYKANMIIPQIDSNLTKSGTILPPDVCPVCGAATEIKNENGVKTLRCPNPACPAKRIKAFTHFVDRNALNIEGLSEMTLEKLIDEGMIKVFADIFKLENHKDRIVEMEGFGELSYKNLVSAVEKAANTTPDRLLYAIGIPNIGVANAKVICKHCHNKWDQIESLTEDELVSIDGVGKIMAKEYAAYFADETNKANVEALLEMLTLDESFEETGDTFAGKTFVITGSLEHFTNRDEAKALIEKLGGKTAGSVSSKTDYLINNDIASNSSKNKKAKELGIPIITEEDFINMTN